MQAKLEELKRTIEGDFFTDSTMRSLYATDASVYREMPLAVARPKSIDDIKKLIKFANQFKTSLIPRTAGTSLAGQVVGSGIVVDVSMHWNKILEVNKEEHWVRIQPGVVCDELNKYLAPYGLMFGPETSTSNRCMIGGMVGNNSCGTHSILYGTTRDHTLELKTILSDGSEVVFKELTKEEFEKKCEGSALENEIYRHFRNILSEKENQDEIRSEFPKPSVRRRNTGYAIDELLETEPFTAGKDKFNFCKLLAGSEGTLAFTTEIKVNLVPIPPKKSGVVAIHLNTVHEATLATIIAMKYKPGAVELIDDKIIECTAQNIEQKKNSFFIQGTPGAIIVVEFERDSIDEINRLCDELEKELKLRVLDITSPESMGMK